MVEWIWDISGKNIILPGSLIQTKLNQLPLEIIENLPTTEKISSKFSSGSIEKFKKRNGFKMYRHMASLIILMNIQ